MMFHKSVLLVFICLLLGVVSQAQELNAGIGLGYNVIQGDNRIDFDEKSSATIGAIFEWRPIHAIFSLNTGARVITDPASANVAFPFYLKFIIGNKFRVCPFLGVFVNTHSNKGVTFGGSIEVPIQQKYNLFFQYELYGEYYKTKPGDHESTGGRGAQWIGIGLKYNLLKKKE